MGLAERRATRAFQDNHYPGFERQIGAAAGFAVPIEVDWASLATEDQAATYEDNWPKIYFRPLVEALKAIAHDDLGKEALQADLKRIVIQNSAGNYSSDRWASFRGGVLTLNHDPQSNVDYIDDRRQKLVATLERREESRPSLAERRASKAFEENSYPALKRQIEEAAGGEVSLEVRWPTLLVKGQSELYDECWPKVYFKPLIEALRHVTRDPLGKEALRAGLKKVVVQNSCGNYSSDSWVSFRGGVLVLDHDPTSNADYLAERKQRLIFVLEKHL